MPRLLLVSPTGILGGAERILHSIASYHVKNGWDVTFYVMSRGRQPGWSELEESDNFKLIVSDAPSEKRSLFSFVFSIVKLSKEKRFDYVVSSHTHINAILSFLRRLGLIEVGFLIGRESTFIFDRFSGIKKIIFYLLYRFFYGEHDLLVCQTDRMKASLETALKFSPAKNVLAIPNPINIERIDSGCSGGSVKGLFPEGSKRIVACGRLVPIKGFDVLIESFAKIRSAGIDASLFIVGDGPEKERLCRLAKSKYVDNYVFLLGYQENPASWLNEADVGVVSSEREGFPNVILEMMAARVKNIVSTPCTDGLNILPDISVSAEFSVDSLFEEMQSVLKCNMDRSSIYRRYVVENRSVASFWSEIVKNVDDNE